MTEQESVRIDSDGGGGVVVLRFEVLDDSNWRTPELVTGVVDSHRHRNTERSECQSGDRIERQAIAPGWNRPEVESQILSGHRRLVGDSPELTGSRYVPEAVLEGHDGGARHGIVPGRIDFERGRVRNRLGRLTGVQQDRHRDLTDRQLLPWQIVSRRQCCQQQSVRGTGLESMKKNQEKIAKANALSRLAAVVQDSSDAMTVQNLEGDIQAWNPSAEKIYGWSEAEALTMNIRDIIPKDLREGALAKVQQLSEAAILEPYITQRICKNGKIITVTMISTALVDETGIFFAIATTERKRDM